MCGELQWRPTHKPEVANNLIFEEAQSGKVYQAKIVMQAKQRQGTASQDNNIFVAKAINICIEIIISVESQKVKKSRKCIIFQTFN